MVTMKSVSFQTCALPTGGLSRGWCSSIHFGKSSDLSMRASVTRFRSPDLRRILELDADVHGLGIEIERMQPAFAPDPGELRPAEGRAQVAQEPAVHPGDADFHRLADAVAAREICRPHR